MVFQELLQQPKKLLRPTRPTYTFLLIFALFFLVVNFYSWTIGVNNQSPTESVPCEVCNCHHENSVTAAASLPLVSPAVNKKIHDRPNSWRKHFLTQSASKYNLLTDSKRQDWHNKVSDGVVQCTKGKTLYSYLMISYYTYLSIIYTIYNQNETELKYYFVDAIHNIL